MWIYDLFLWSSPNHTPIKYTCLIKNTNWIIPAYLKSMASATSMTRSRPTSPVVEHLHVALHTTPHQKGPRMYVYRSCSSILATLASLVPMWVWWPITNNCESITAYCGHLQYICFVKGLWQFSSPISITNTRTSLHLSSSRPHVARISLISLRY